MIIENKTYDCERALYNARNLKIVNCNFEGAADGESALKEGRSICAENCKFALRYPLWHDVIFDVKSCVFCETCRAPLWYSKNGKISDCEISGTKALRECDGVRLENCNVKSEEFGWKCRNTECENCRITSQYAFLGAENGELSSLDFHGKYSFQYTKNLIIKNSLLDTKDAFWHSENVTVENSVISGEYLGWYSKNLTLVNCTLKGTQPLCYCEGLKLVNCKTEDADSAFEYSDADAEITGNIVSVKNPKSGRIVADGIGEIIKSDFVYPPQCEIIIRK